MMHFVPTLNIVDTYFLPCLVSRVSCLVSRVSSCDQHGDFLVALSFAGPRGGVPGTPTKQGDKHSKSYQRD
jgi:hypothetical protein